MTDDHDDPFSVRPSAPRTGPRGERFVTQVLRAAGTRSFRKKPGGSAGRGLTAARFAGQKLTAKSRRVVVKIRLLKLASARASGTQKHLRYIEREGVGPDREPGRAYGAETDNADSDAFVSRSQQDRHQFRIIVAPEDGSDLGDLRGFTRHLMSHVERDLGTELDWVAVDHWNTDNPHTHIILRGCDTRGRDLVIARNYLSHGMRQRACELATQWLGPRTELEIQQSAQREVTQARWTGLDRTLQRISHNGVIQAKAIEPILQGRLKHLETLGLTRETSTDNWALRPDLETVLRALGERNDIIRTMQRALGQEQRNMNIFDTNHDGPTIVGRIMARGWLDELSEQGYLILDSADGRAHYVPLSPNANLDDFPVDGIVSARPTAMRAIDQAIAANTRDGYYRAAKQSGPNQVAQMRRLEALRRAGIVERLSDGLWQIPSDLAERTRSYDARCLAGATVSLRSHLSIGQQVRAIGATWLDEQLVSTAQNSRTGVFGSQVNQALALRTEFLLELGLAKQSGQRVILASNLLATLRERELATTVQALHAENGRSHRPLRDGERASGIYRRSLQLVSGRFAMLDDGMGFTLVPWKPVIEKHLGHHISAVIQNSRISWDVTRQRDISP